MFFGAEDSVLPSDKYDDIIEIGRTADELGFKALWTPERHFQKFGRVFPSPSVLGAALAVSTQNIEIRAGSVVLPLHHPLRVAEEWAVVDNLSRGRVGLSIATGWHSKDFVLAPERYTDRRKTTLENINVLRRLWAGEAAEFTDGLGEPVEVSIQPTPVTKSLPLWLTTSGSVETWSTAGQLGMGILAASIGQTRKDLAEKIQLYRQAFGAVSDRRTADHAARGTVSLMMHAFVGDSESAVRARVRKPLHEYLRAFAMQMRNHKGADGGQAMAALSEVDHERLVEFAFQRYVAGGSLLGTPETCLRTMVDLSDLGVDEIACFVDFGFERHEVLTTLRRLSDVRESLSRQTRV
ncbi:MupA/Atu3671 family FMN-dependent luciferase-like monooxygenase [Streptomyces sp. 900116325]